MVSEEVVQLIDEINEAFFEFQCSVFGTSNDIKAVAELVSKLRHYDTLTTTTYINNISGELCDSVI